MKKMLLIGGIISTVLPAMATDLDLSGYHLVDGVEDTCTGPEGYSGFTSGEVDMTPLYIQQCAPGSYLNVTNLTQVAQHTTNDELDYYYIDACTQCTTGQYSAGVSNPAPDANGVLSTTGLGECPQTYPLSDGTRSSQNDCYKTCSNENITTAMKDNMKASNVTYAHDGTAHYGNECEMHINACAAGYDLIDLATGGTFALNNSAWTLTKSERSYEGTFGCTDDACSITFGNNTVPVATYADNATCLTSCGSQANVAAAIAKVANNNYLTDGTSFCAAKIVNINWAGVSAADAEEAGADTCTYDGALTTPTAPEKAGYKFVGWTVGEYQEQVAEPEEPGIGG